MILLVLEYVVVRLAGMAQDAFHIRKDHLVLVGEMPSELFHILAEELADYLSAALVAAFHELFQGYGQAAGYHFAVVGVGASQIGDNVTDILFLKALRQGPGIPVGIYPAYGKEGPGADSVASTYLFHTFFPESEAHTHTGHYRKES